MKIYVPVFRDGEREVQEIDSLQARYRHTPGYTPSITYRNTSYCGQNIYTTEDGAWADWRRDTKNSIPHLIKAEEIEFKSFKSFKKQ